MFCHSCFVRMEHSIANHYVHLRNEAEKEGVSCGWGRVEIEKAKRNLKRAEREELGVLREQCFM